MPIIVSAKDTKVMRQGPGWQEIGLADAGTFGEPAMVARRWVFEPGARGPELHHGDVDELLYVIRGGGEAIVDGQALSLSEESVLWLEPGEQFQFIAGEAGLEILQGFAPEASGQT